jgi:CRP-like cAMP-binding protein
MSDDLLFSELRAKADLSEADYIAYRKLFTQHSFKKEEHLFKAGDHANFVVFIVKGCMRIYYSKGDRPKHTIYFAEERWWTGDLVAMRAGVRTDQNLQALEDCEVLVMSKENWEYAYKNFQWFADFHVTGHQRWLNKLNEQIGRLLLDTPEENYRRLIKERPSLVRRLPDYYIAGYLGISPEALAQIRQKITEETKRINSA